jgi:hypothetical protein
LDLSSSDALDAVEREVKMTIGKNIISQLADYIFKMTICLQDWRLLSRAGDKQAFEMT